MVRWFVLGMVVGLVYAGSLIGSVGRLGPARASWSARRIWLAIATGYALRVGLIAAGLTLATRESAGAGLLTFAGFWLARWTPIYLGGTGRIDWSRYD